MTVIAIDGPAGAGKSTVAREVARTLGFTHLDSGALYRAVALAALDRGVAPDDVTGLEALVEALRIELKGARVWIDGAEETHRLRSGPVTEAASKVAGVPGVRSTLLGLQRKLAEGTNVVMEGRDIGSVVFPEAPVKIYLTASIEERARRRYEEGPPDGGPTLEELASSIAKRDEADSRREASPLTLAPGAVVVDSTGKPVATIVDQVVTVVTKTAPAASKPHPRLEG